jgi:uncharacterized membrane protein
MASEREAGADRVIAFSDGVVAIAITLLVLPLTEIERGERATLRSVAVDNSGALFAFALSFAVIANYWTIHKDIFRPLRRHDPRLVLLNMLWLAAIVFLPFPTSLIADGPTAASALCTSAPCSPSRCSTFCSPTTSGITPSSPTARQRRTVATMSQQVPSQLAHSLSRS